MKKKDVALLVFVAGVILRWATWITMAAFDSREAIAVTDTKYSNILQRLDEIKTELKGLKK